MSRISEEEEFFNLPPKVLGMYRAVMQLIGEGEDPGSLRVSTITERAGIGKGTAYEYFDSKEEIVVNAIVYQILSTIYTLEQGLSKWADFQGQLDFLLDACEHGEGKNCFLKLVHLLTDNSELSAQVRAKLDSKNFEQYRPVPFLRKVLGKALERGELRDDLPTDYMVYSLGSRLLAYMWIVNGDGDGLQTEVPRMRELVRRGILAELCAERSKQA